MFIYHYAVEPGYVVGFDGIMRGCLDYNLTAHPLPNPGWVDFTSGITSALADLPVIFTSGKVYFCDTEFCNTAAVVPPTQTTQAATATPTTAARNEAGKTAAGVFFILLMAATFLFGF